MLTMDNMLLLRTNTAEDLMKLCEKLDELCILHHKTVSNGVIIQNCESSVALCLAGCIDVIVEARDLSRTVAFMLIDKDITDELDGFLTGISYYQVSKRVFYVDEWNALRAKLILNGAHIRFTQSRAEYFLTVLDEVHSA